MNTPKGREKIFALFICSKDSLQKPSNFVHTTIVISTTFDKERWGQIHYVFCVNWGARSTQF